MARILIVDDSSVDRHLAGSLLGKRDDMTVAYAADGQEGLAAIDRQPPDLVLTDLQMPGLNGLELVEQVRAKHPLVPVILMTAHGSEEIAIQALQRGAASYVPKRNLAQDLLDTVEHVLSVATARSSRERMQECLMRVESEYILDNDPGLVPAMVGRLREGLEGMKLCDETGLIRVTIALSEALTNAIIHGNLEVGSALRGSDDVGYEQLVQERRRQKPFRDRRVTVLAQEMLHEARYIIRDEGPGFNPSTLPDPTDPANMEKASGRGLLLIRTFMDQVYHNEHGNQITMIKRRDP
jgi:CheY-like chemotaxis protein/anti-sigma regulatory factor (Ser/Thr protein kinase)